MRFQTAQTFLEQLRHVADVRPSHPSWWGPLLALVLCPDASRTLGDGTPESYRNANGGPDSDTFMARPTTALPDAAAYVARAVARARRALDELNHLDGKLPEQPLFSHLVNDQNWLRATSFAGPRERVAFVLPNRVLVARLSRGDEFRLAADLAAAVSDDSTMSTTLEEIDPNSPKPTPAAVAIGLFPSSLAAARHLHRRAWTRGGGPWLGVSDADESSQPRHGGAFLGTVSTCHVAIDGFGHLLLTTAVLNSADARVDEHDPLATAARAHLKSTHTLSDPVPRWRMSPYGFAARVLPAAPFKHQAYAFGRALNRVMKREKDRRRSGFSTVFQVPVVPGARTDAERVYRRARHALMSLKIDNGQLESLASFVRRLPNLLAAERDGHGAIAELAASVAHVPFPSSLRQRFLRTHRQPHDWLPAQEILSGRGRLSSLVLSKESQTSALPIYAASAPPMLATASDPRGSLVLTVIRHGEDKITASVFGSGLMSTTEGADRFLEIWCEELKP